MSPSRVTFICQKSLRIVLPPYRVEHSPRLASSLLLVVHPEQRREQCGPPHGSAFGYLEYGRSYEVEPARAISTWSRNRRFLNSPSPHRSSRCSPSWRTICRSPGPSCTSQNGTASDQSSFVVPTTSTCRAVIFGRSTDTSPNY